MSSWTELLDRAEPGEHVVQLYGADEQFLARNVSRYLAEGLKRGDGLILIATSLHADSILGQLRDATPEVAGALRQGQLVSLDAAATLAGFMCDGQPDRAMFETVIGGALREVRAQATSGKVRAFGEMVGLLWAEGNRLAAILLEDYWNDLMRRNEFSLFCGYPIDLFGDLSEMEGLHSVLGTHTHLLAGPATMLSSARA
jgi:hypothetical protein